MCATLTAEIRGDVQTLWDYHQMGHELQPVVVAIGLGSHDLGVADYAAGVYFAGLADTLVFTGANAPTTREVFPRGEAVHYRDRALELGVPYDAIIVEPRATNTGENITYTRDLLFREYGFRARKVMLISRPYQQRRAYATCRKLWPAVDVICASRPQSLDEYVATIGDVDRVVDMLVGDTQRIEVYAQRGFAIPQTMPAEVRAAWHRLAAAGYTSRLVAA